MSWPCGAADFVSQLARNLDLRGIETTVVTSNENADETSWRYRIHKIPGTWNLAHVKKIAEWIRKENFDVVDFQYEAAMYGYRGAALLLPMFLKTGKSTLTLTFHSQDLPRRGGRLWRPMQVLPYDGLVIYSKHLRDRLLRWFPNHGERFLLQGFPSSILRAASPDVQPLMGKIKTGYLKSPFIMLYFGHINPRRGIEEVLDSLVALKKDGLEPHFILMSKFDPETEDYHRMLVQRLKADGLEGQVSFTGRLANEEVSRFLQASDLCVLPFPDGASFKNSSLAAAIDHGVPVVTTISELTEEELLKDGALQTYPPGDVQALTRLLKGLVSNPERIAELRRRTTALREMMSWKNYIDARLAFYQRIGAKAAPAAIQRA